MTTGRDTVDDARQGSQPVGVSLGEGLAITLRLGRRATGLSLTQASERLGISRCHLHELEAGRATNPTLATLAAVRELYGISADALLDCA